MVKYRKRGKRSYGAIKRRRFNYRKRRYARKSMHTRKLRENVHSYKRYTVSQNFNYTNSSGVEYDAAISFQLSDVINKDEFVNLYDRFRIKYVVFTISMPNVPESYWAPSSATTVNALGIYPRIWYCPDYDDTAAITLNDIKQRPQTKMRFIRPNRNVKIVVRPAVNGQAYRTALSTAYTPMWRPWIDMAQNDTPHYGLKYCIDLQGFAPLAALPCSFVVEKCYYFDCKDVR